MGGYMYKKAIEVLNKLVENGYLAYIVGGYPRDTLLGIKTKDIDICTNATPNDIEKMFEPAFMMVLCGVAPFAYKREDGVYVVPVTSLKD